MLPASLPGTTSYASAVGFSPEDLRRRLDAVEEQDPVEVVDFVEEAAGLEAVGLHAPRAAVAIAALDDDVGRAAHVAGEVGDREAALAADRGAARLDDHRIDEH